MITNTSEWKERFFALYWDQWVLDFNTRSGMGIGEATIRIASKPGAYLSLRPISGITEGEAIEAAAVFYDIPFDSPKPHKWIVNRKKDYISVETKYNAYHYCFWLDGTKFVVYEEDEISIFGDEIMLADYFRSKGFALPYMGLSVETLVEWGWIKIKQS